MADFPNPLITKKHSLKTLRRDLKPFIRSLEKRIAAINKQVTDTNNILDLKDEDFHSIDRLDTAAAMLHDLESLRHDTYADKRAALKAMNAACEGFFKDRNPDSKIGLFAKEYQLFEIRDQIRDDLDPPLEHPAVTKKRWRDTIARGDGDDSRILQKHIEDHIKRLTSSAKPGSGTGRGEPTR